MMLFPAMSGAGNDTFRAEEMENVKGAPSFPIKIDVLDRDRKSREREGEKRRAAP